MDAKEYMNRIGIEDIQKRLTEKEIQAYVYSARTGDYTPIFQLGVDDKLECIDYKSNIIVLGSLAELTESMQDYLEPFCSSGFVSCFLAQDAEHYTGIDKNELGVNLAKARAVVSGVNPEFIAGDFYEYNKEHEVIVSRFGITVAKNKDLENTVAKMTDLSKNIVIVQIPQPDFNSKDKDVIQSYTEAEQKRFIEEFKKHNYKAEVLIDAIPCFSNGLEIYTLEARK